MRLCVSVHVQGCVCMGLNVPLCAFACVCACVCVLSQVELMAKV